MTRVFLAIFLLLWSVPVLQAGDVYVHPYVKKDGTYVQGHYRSSPNSTTLDNWSTKGNVNPYTGALGTRNPAPKDLILPPPFQTPRWTPPKVNPPATFNAVRPHPWCFISEIERMAMENGMYTPTCLSPPPTVRHALATKVIDGDTIRLDTGEVVRLIGVDTPETKHPRKPVQHFGMEASAFTRRMVEGKTVYLELDQDAKDKYGRTLAYVYLDDGTLLNAEIIREGYGHTYTRFPFSRMDEFRSYEKKAREKGKGLWKNGAQ